MTNLKNEKGRGGSKMKLEIIPGNDKNSYKVYIDDTDPLLFTNASSVELIVREFLNEKGYHLNSITWRWLTNVFGAVRLTAWGNCSPINEPKRSLPPDAMNEEERRIYEGLYLAARAASQTAVDRGWYNDPKTGEKIKRNFGEVIALMHSELSEALEHDRRGTKDDKLPHRDGREVEFADCIIRILDTAEDLGLDVAGAFIEKNRYNRKRDDHKLENRVKDGGKKY